MEKNKEMLLVFVDRLTNRVDYVLHLIFRDVMGVPFQITTKKEEFGQHDGPKICYGSQPLAGAFFIPSHSLLFETTIESQEIHMFDDEGMQAFFQTASPFSDFSFDIFAATFYLVTRYEEYLPFFQDRYGRFKHESSLAFQKKFLHKPLVNHWVGRLCAALKTQYPNFVVPEQKFKFLNTIDIDSVWCFRGKGLFRQFFGCARDILFLNFSLVAKRFRVLLRLEPDPFDTFDFQFSVQKKYNIETIYFILFGAYGSYDKNISSLIPSFRTQIRQCQDYAEIGIHPSFVSFVCPEKMSEEIKDLASVVHEPITSSRFHYLRMRIPSSYRVLLDNEIESDYTMGYPGEYGFRASICSPYYFYDLERDGETKLKIYPFAVMDATLHHHLKKTPEEGLQIMKQMIDEVRAVRGTFISIWHNESLSNQYSWEGWRDVYEQMIAYASGQEMVADS